MPNYGLPGVAADRRGARLTGGLIVLLVLAVAAATLLYRTVRGEDGLSIALHTEEIGDGVVSGTQVRLDGVLVGSVADIAPDERGTQRITLRLDPARLFGIDDSLRVDYAPANLFGISELELRRGPGGRPLQADQVIDLTGPRAGDIYDATMGSILRSLSQVGASVLSPQMAQVIAQVSADFQAFTPLVQALITVARTVADNQNMPASELVGRLGPAFDGGGKFAGAVIQILDRINSIAVLKGDRAHYDSGVSAVTDQLLPGLADTAGTAGKYFGDGANELAPVLSALAPMVPHPQQTAAELRALLERLRAAMPDTPNGPMLNVEADVRGAPSGPAPAGGER
ncbi:mammalian cell entry protein [Nocardia panacis]|uniref:Mammalian cell entry protein n=1 Tax=Nocardia panacis TaxID=2340916 RepID=A0A3A4KPH7_9NOCA|nr:MlaD family protein [Nocardia panacis]RJO79382.1 mammalian cell entry protein [Nocardia panacis]